MFHILGHELSLSKKLKFFFSSFYGINRYTTSYILGQIGINEHKKGSSLLAKHFTQITNLIEKNLIIEEKLRRIQNANIGLLILMSSYRGIRHRQCLPTRGQRTHTNAKTCKRKLKKKN